MEARAKPFLVAQQKQQVIDWVQQKNIGKIRNHTQHFLTH